MSKFRFSKLFIKPERTLYGIVKAIIMFPLATIAFGFFTFMVLSDVFAPAADLQTVTGTIQEVKYQTTRTKKSGKSRHFLEIRFLSPHNYPYTIEINGGYEDYQSAILAKENIGENIHVSFISHLYSDGVIHNPNQLFIDHKEIIAYDSNRIIESLLIFFIVSMTIVFFLLSCKYWRLFIRDFLFKKRRYSKTN